MYYNSEGMSSVIMYMWIPKQQWWYVNYITDKLNIRHAFEMTNKPESVINQIKNDGATKTNLFLRLWFSINR